jgi:hypothetical protein
LVRSADTSASVGADRASKRCGGMVDRQSRDGMQSTVKLPVEMWNLGPEFVYRVPQKKRVGRAEVDPRRALPDIDRTNNIWPRASRSP